VTPRMAGNQICKKPAKGIGRRFKRQSSSQVQLLPLPPNFGITENAIQELHQYFQDAAAIVGLPEETVVTGGRAKRSRADDGYRATRAVKSATAKKLKAETKAKQLRKNNASLKKQIDATKSAVKSSEHQRYVECKLHRTTVFESEERHSLTVESIHQEYAEANAKNADAVKKTHDDELRSLKSEHKSVLKSTKRQHQSTVKRLEKNEKLLQSKIKSTETESQRELDEIKHDYFTKVQVAQDFANDLQAKLLKEEAKRIAANFENDSKVRKERQTAASTLAKVKSTLSKKNAKATATLQKEKSGQEAVLDHLQEQWRKKLSVEKGKQTRVHNKEKKSSAKKVSKNAADEKATLDREHQDVVDLIHKKVERKEDEWAKERRQYERR
jgi:hypothetical protein